MLTAASNLIAHRASIGANAFSAELSLASVAYLRDQLHAIDPHRVGYSRLRREELHFLLTEIAEGGALVRADDDVEPIGAVKFRVTTEADYYAGAPLTRAGSGRAHLARGSYPRMTDESIAAFLAGELSQTARQASAPYFDTRRIAADAFADGLGAQRPTDAVVSNDQRYAQWGSRLALVPHAKTEEARAAALAEANSYSGQPQPPRPWPASMPVSVLPPQYAEASGNITDIMVGIARLIEQGEVSEAA